MFWSSQDRTRSRNASWSGVSEKSNHPSRRNGVDQPRTEPRFILAGCGKSWNPLRSSTDPKGNEEETMRGEDRKADGLFSYLRPEQRVPADHPLRPIREMVDIVLRELSPEFARLYAPN